MGTRGAGIATRAVIRPMLDHISPYISKCHSPVLRDKLECFQDPMYISFPLKVSSAFWNILRLIWSPHL